MSLALLVLLGVRPPDESALREAFSKEIQSKEASTRIEAIKRLAGSKEEKTIVLLVACLKDEAKDVQLAAAVALEGCEDGAGAALKPLGEVLTDKKVDPDVRLSCAKALAKSKYKTVPITSMIAAIGAISNTERHLHKFGADVTDLLNKCAGQDFGKGKTTAFLWEQWFDDNKAKFAKDDATLLEAYRKSSKN
jgi:HEAT repeat protein